MTDPLDDPFAELNPPYSTIVADPPWHYAKVNPDKDGEDYRGGGLAYSSMTVAEVRALPVGDLGSDVRCFLWVTNRYLRHGWSVLESWGFEPQDRSITEDAVRAQEAGNPTPVYLDHENRVAFGIGCFDCEGVWPEIKAGTACLAGDEWGAS